MVICAYMSGYTYFGQVRWWPERKPDLDNDTGKGTEDVLIAIPTSYIQICQKRTEVQQ